MSKIIDRNISLYEAMENINSGKYVMPAFQRQYVWSLCQIEKLWDSILLDYPIASFLLWHLDENNVSEGTHFCNFLNDVTFDSRKQADSINYDTSIIDLGITDTAILDGQQRLTSLFISLYGSAAIRPKFTRRNTKDKIYCKLLIELDENKIDVNEEEYNAKKYDIRFTDKAPSVSPTQFEIKNILNHNFKNIETRKEIIEKSIKFIPENSKDYARNILNKLATKIYDEKIVRVTEIFDMDQDDALEMFVRFNSGGKVLSKSQITMSILEVYWGQSKEKFGQLLSGVYSGFGSDFIIRTALMLYGDVIKSNINRSMAIELRENWDKFSEALDKLNNILKELKIDIHRFEKSWNVLLPIIYEIYYNDNYHDDILGMKSYLIRAILFSYFASGTTTKLNQMRNSITNNNFSITTGMLDQMGLLRITDARLEDIVNSEKGSRIAGEALYYLGLDWISETASNLEQDHLHPYDRFESNKPPMVQMGDWLKWRSYRNKLPNIHLLEWRANTQKSNMSLVQYYDSISLEQQKLFKAHAMLPENESLEIEYFSDFYEARKALLISKLKNILQ